MPPALSAIATSVGTSRSHACRRSRGMSAGGASFRSARVRSVNTFCRHRLIASVRVA